jgi:sorting nexin-25
VPLEWRIIMTYTARKQVNRFLYALSTLQQPLPIPAPISAGGRNLPPASSISIHSSSKHFDQFLRSISKVKALGEARRLRADVERELRNVSSVATDQTNDKDVKTKGKYVERLERAKSHIDERILVLSGEPSKVS